MKNIVVILTLALSLARPVSSEAGTISNDFVIYLKRFSHEAQIRGIRLDRMRVNDTSIKFGFDLHDYHTLAECNMDTLQISVSESYWLTASDLEREELIFHELGHCILGRGHEDGVMPISGGMIYKSVMNSAGNALMYRYPDPKRCTTDVAFDSIMSVSSANDCGIALVYSPKSKTNFYSKYRKIYMDELFGVVAPNKLTDFHH